MTDKTGGPAFPIKGPLMTCDEQGVTLRDWFAGLAMQGMLACGEQHDANTSSVLSEDAYKIADTMLKAREAK